LGQEYDADEILINHNAEVDLQLRFGSVKVGLEVEEARSHTTDQLVKKKEDALEKYDVVKFVCSGADSKTISSVVGDSYTLQKGSAVREFFQSLTDNSQLRESVVNISEINQIEAV
jgi:hypothetical protein